MRTAPDGGTADIVGERKERPSYDELMDELMELARQYLSDMRHPPAAVIRRRRVEWINSVIGKD